MINNDRIVPVEKTDLLTLIGTIMNIANVSFTALAANDVEGNFTVTGSGAVGNILADQPVKSLDFASGVTGATVYFIAAYDYVGIKLNGAAITPTGTINPDGATLYKAVLSDSAVTVTAVSPTVSAS